MTEKRTAGVTPVEELAKKAGVSKVTIYKYANRLGRVPTFDELQAMRRPTGRPRKFDEVK